MQKFADIEDFNTYTNYPDVFDREFEEWADYVARSACVEMAEEPFLLGYADVPVPAITADKPGAWAEGLDLDNPDDLAQLEAGMALYDAFYRWARDATDEQHNWPSAKPGS